MSDRVFDWLLKAIVSLTVVFVIGGVLFLPPKAGPVGAAPEQAGTLKRERVVVDTSGSAGSASGSAQSGLIVGRVVRVDIDYAAGLTTTTDLTLAGVNDLVATNIVNRANTVTDAQLFPTTQLTDNTGTGRTFDGTRPVVVPYPVADRLTLSVAQSTAMTPAVTIDIYYEEP